METTTNGRTYRFGFKQQIKQKDYVNHVYKKLNNCCGSKPITNRKGLDFQFKTLTLPCFRFYGHQFYGKNHKKKVPRLIHRWLTPRVLAYWYMDDGYRHKNGCYLFTNCFEKEDVQRLCNAIQRNFKFDCGIRKKTIDGKDYWFLYISTKSFKEFSVIIKPYVVPLMKYKLYKKK